jgi:hypothetical protein
MKQYFWSRKSNECKKCGLNVNPHKGNGLCILCYDKIRAKTPNGRKNQANYRNKHRREIYQRQKEDYLKKRNLMLFILGGKCVRCGFQDIRALQIDHINGGGIKERKLLNTKDFHRKVLKSLKNKENKYQLLCANCNWIKRSENKEWGRTPKKYL